MRIFEGSRRLGMAGAALLFGAVLVFNAIHKPTVTRTYLVTDPEKIAVQVAHCEPSDAIDVEYAIDSWVGEGIVQVCFRPLGIPSDGLAIAYGYGKPAPGAERYLPILLDQPWSEKVKAYRIRRVSQLATPQVRSAIEQEVTSMRLKQTAEGLVAALAGAALWWGLVCLVGWVVRGFLGIPSGADSRRDAPN